MNPVPASDSELNGTASDWIARRDRGLTPGERAELDAWLESPAHAAAFARCEAAWSGLARLHGRLQAQRDPLGGPRRRLRVAGAWFATAAAAMLALSVFLPHPAVAPATARVQIYAAPADIEARFALSDGSVAVLRRGSRIEFGEFSDRRAARLLTGEAHFTVAKSSPAPFFVHAGSMTIRDIGTAFNVRLEPNRVAVLVTEGQIAVRSRPGPGGGRPSAPAVKTPELILGLGEEAIVDGDGVACATRVPPSTVEQALAWKSRRLTFDRTSLAEAVTELNRYNVRQLRIADPAIAGVLLAGGVQSDNLDAFVRLLDSGFGISADSDGREIVLRRAD